MTVQATPLLRRPPRARARGRLALLAAVLVASGGTTRVEADELAMAGTARASVVRVRWRSERFGDLTNERNAIVVQDDGLLLMAGPPPSREGTLTVTLADGSTHRATVLAFDARTALTLLRIPPTDLRPLPLHPPFGATAAARPAATLAGTADPLGMPPLGMRLVMVTGDAAVGFGTVRSVDRHGTVADPLGGRPLHTTGLFGAAIASIDLDAGSPLLDVEGRVVGLMVGRRSILPGERVRAAAARGLTARPEPVETVAVPVDVIHVVLPLLKADGRVPRGSLGVTTEAVGEAMRTHLRLDAGGHLVRALEPDGPGGRGGLRLHDVIVAVGGHVIRPDTTLHDALLPFRPHAAVVVRLIRGGEPLEIEVVLGEG